MVRGWWEGIASAFLLHEVERVSQRLDNGLGPLMANATAAMLAARFFSDNVGHGSMSPKAKFC